MTANEVLIRMLNSFAPEWPIDAERVNALLEVSSFARPHEREVLLEMIRDAHQGATVWVSETKRILAVKGALLASHHPTADTLKKVARAVAAGAATDGVAERPWVKDAIRMLETMSKLTP